MVISRTGILQFGFRNGWIGLLLAYVILFIVTLSSYIEWQSVNFIVGILSIPLVVDLQPGKFSYRYGIAALVIGIISLLLPITTLIYFLVLFAILFVIESFWGRMGKLLLFILVFISPVFQYFLNVFSFPIRLWLTGWAGGLLNVFNGNAVVEGNTILYKGNEFSVDPACMGLNMLLLSMIISIVFTAHYHRIAKKEASVVALSIVLGTVLLLNIVSNLLRIIFMVQFAVLPGTIAHDLYGLIFFLIYVIIPLRFIIKRMIVRKPGKGSDATHTAASPGLGTMQILMHGVLLILVFFSCWRSNTQNKVSDMPGGERLAVSGYKVQLLPFHTIKLEKEDALVYIKFVEAFYNADHTPYICWRGSGYQFRNIRKENIGGLKVYGGKLEKNKETLSTAWWYQHNNDCTLNQFTWRWKMLKGDGNYALVNVTARTREELLKEIMFISRNKPFIHLLN